MILLTVTVTLDIFSNNIGFMGEQVKVVKNVVAKLSKSGKVSVPVFIAQIVSIENNQIQN